MNPDKLLYNMALAALLKQATTVTGPGALSPHGGAMAPPASPLPPIPGMPVPPGAAPPPGGGGPKLPEVSIKATGDAVQHLPGILRGGMHQPGQMAGGPPAAPTPAPQQAPAPQQGMMSGWPSGAQGAG